MYLYRKILLGFILVLFSCAVQSLPPGGSPDTESPYVKKISPQNKSNPINNNQEIELIFNEMIDPKTVKSSIEIFPELDFKINSYNNKIIIKPKNGWPENKVIKIYLSRLISDYKGNKLNEPIALTYGTLSEIPNNTISGHIFNYNEDKIANIGLYEIKDNQLFLNSITQNDINNRFNFNDLENGEYLLIGIDGPINNIYNDIRLYDYALSEKKIVIDNNSHNNLDLNFSTPLYRKEIKSTSTINQNYSFINMNDNSVIHLINKDAYNQKFNDISSVIYFDSNDDSLNLSIKLNNKIENYILNKKIKIEDSQYDSIPPMIDDSKFSNGKISLYFSEPIIIKHGYEDSIFWFLDSDSIKVPLKYSMVNPLELSINSNNNFLKSINIENKAIYDLSDKKNVLSDTLYFVDTHSHFASKKAGSNIFGKVIYEGKNDIIVEAINIVNGNMIKQNIDKFGNYSFLNLEVGKYKIWTYENLNKVSDNYYNGTLEPVSYSAKFSYYDGIIETRAKWDIEDIRLKIK